MKQNISEKYKNTFKCLNYVEHLRILASTVTGWVLVSPFATLVAIFVATTSFPVAIKICAVTVGVKIYKSIIKKNKKHDKIVLFGKIKLNSIEVFVSEALIGSCISHDKFVSVNNVLREYYKIKEETKLPETSVECIM